MQKYWIYFLGFLLINACSKEIDKSSGNNISGFPPVVELKGERVFKNQYGLAQIFQLDSLIAISTTTDTMFHIYNKEGTQLARFGQKGPGPNELSRTFAIEDVVKNNSTIKAYIFEELRKELVTINMTASIDSSKLIVEKRQPIPDKIQGAFDFLFINNQKFIGIYDDHFNKRLDQKRGGFYFYPQKNNFKTFKLFNLTVEPYEIMPATNINARMPVISPDRSKVAIAMMHYPRVTIINIADSTHESHLLNSNSPQENFKLDNFKKGNITVYYPYIYASNDYIYLLYSGHKMNQDKHSSIIQIIDWKGNPYKQYLIPDNYNVSMFIVDENNQEFYALSYPKDAVYKFDYSPIK